MRVAFYTLGCKVNQYETQAVTERFMAAGFEIVGEDCFADVYVLNSCSVTRTADRKSRQYIRRMKKQNPDSVMLVMGCYPQTNLAEILKIEEADIILGSSYKMRAVEFVSEFLKENKNSSNPEKKVFISGEPGGISGQNEETEYRELGLVTGLESRTRAMIKIQDGCDRYCSYCIIPYARGTPRSRKPEAVLEEAKRLIKQGYKELVLTGINTALYGREEGFKSSFEDLVAKLCSLPGDFRIRLGSLEPTVVDSAYLAGLLKYDKLCRHLHLSLQSGSNKVLSAMNRHYTREDYLAMVETLRAFDANYGITTDIIVGFPGESEEDFEESVDLVREAGFLKVHGFPYSRRPYTEAARLPKQIDSRIKKERNRRLASAASDSSLKFRAGMAGSVQRVLTEEICNAELVPGSVVWKGHADNFTTVYFAEASGRDLSNQFVNVRIIRPFKEGVFALISD